MTDNQQPQGPSASPPDDSLPASEKTGAEEAGAGSRSSGQDPNPLASGQLVESPQSNTRMADDPLGGKQPADDPLGSDPITLDRRNPPRAPGL
ncbi:MAG TPA: hypothetical protein VGK98_02620 [Arthrobacter sp.]|jgi:hypothetical protein|uniref:hypothetical protein n=1 Tax=Arthrobacter sp. TaxID=1667 RepID=UPI002F3F5199